MERLLKDIFPGRWEEFMEDLRDIAGESEVLVGEEESPSGRRKVYYLDEDARKLRVYFESLAEFEDKYLVEMAKIRSKLLEIMTGQARSMGGIFTIRTVSASLSDALFLLRLFRDGKLRPEDIGISEDKVKDILLWWAPEGYESRILAPTDYLPLALERLKKRSIFALYYLTRFADYVSGTSVRIEKIEEIYDKISEFKTREDHELAWKLITQVSFLHLLILIKSDPRLLNVFRALQREAEDIKSETLRKIIQVRLKSTEIGARYITFSSNRDELENAKRELGEIRSLIDEIKELDEATRKYLDVYGNPEKRFERIKHARIADVNYLLGKIQLRLGDERAVESFESAYEGNYKIWNYNDALVDLSLKHRAEICFNWSFGETIDLSELRREFEKYRFVCFPEIESGIYAMLAVAEALKGGNVKEFVENVEHSLIKALLLGVLAVIGKWGKDDAIAELKREDELSLRARRALILVLQQNLLDLLEEFAEYHGISLEEARKILGLCIEFLFRPVSDLHSLIRILRLYLEGYLNEAIKTAEWQSKNSPPLPSKLFSQVAEALRKNDDKNFREAVIKLFFYFV